MTTHAPQDNRTNPPQDQLSELLHAAVADFSPHLIEAVLDNEAELHLTLMSPAFFRRLASPVARHLNSRDRLRAIRTALKTKTPFDSLPCLTVEPYTHGWGVSMHDGRHRAMVLSDRPYLPVIFQLEDPDVTLEPQDLTLQTFTLLSPQTPDEDEEYPGFDEDDIREYAAPTFNLKNEGVIRLNSGALRTYLNWRTGQMTGAAGQPRRTRSKSPAPRPPETP